MIDWSDFDYKQTLKYVEKMYENIESLRKENERLKNDFGVIKKYIGIPSFQYKNPNSFYAMKDDKSTYMKQLDNWKKEHEESAKENTEIHEYNKKLVEKIKKMLLDCGLPQKVYYYKTKRSVNQTSMRNPALDAVENMIKYPHPGTSTALITEKRLNELYDKAKEKFEKEQKELEQQRIEAERTKKLEEKKKAKERGFVEFLVKNNLSYEDYPNHDSVIAYLCKRDKFFNLAYAMEQTRNDWNDGFYRIDHALMNFETENEVEEKIYSEIYDLCKGEEEDGRIFRDCQYDYGVLYSEYVKEGIVEMYQELLELK